MSNIYEPPKAKIDGSAERLTLDTRYPFWRVLLVYAALGGAVGGVILWLGMFIVSLFDGFSVNDVFSVFIFGFYGAIFGFIPATLTGWFLAYTRFRRRGWVDYGRILLIGTFATAVYVLGLSLFFFEQEMLRMLIGTPLGGVSGMVLGRLVLPRKESEENV